VNDPQELCAQVLSGISVAVDAWRPKAMRSPMSVTGIAPSPRPGFANMTLSTASSTWTAGCPPLNFMSFARLNRPCERTVNRIGGCLSAGGVAFHVRDAVAVVTYTMNSTNFQNSQQATFAQKTINMKLTSQHASRTQ
jgi:hypothetical protein